MQIKSQKITANLALNSLLVNQVVTDELKVPSGKNIVFACDVSGSMYGSLSQMRTQLKNRIPDVVGSEDTITIIWFSGRGQAGILKEGVKVKDLLDLQALNTAIDRFLQPVGLTAFLPPLQLLEQVIANLSSNQKDFAFTFLSDGYNNDSVWSDVISQLEKLDKKLATSTFIEYGYYADSSALTQMAEIVGGEKVFAKDFDSYRENFDKILGKKTAEKHVVDISSIKDRLTYQFFYTINDDESINIYSCKGKDSLLIPSDVDKLYFYTQYKPKEAEEVSFSHAEILVAAYLLADRLKYKHVEDILLKLGDVKLINQFSGAYGKQKLNELKDSIKNIAFGKEKLFSEGQNSAFKINPKQYCVMDMIDDLANGYNKFFPFHPDFNYNRIGAKRTNKIELDDDTKDALKGAKTLKEIEKITNEIEGPEFIYPENAAEIGMSFDTLVWNQERANLSVQTKVTGKVKLPKNEFGLDEVESFIYRNYTLIKDGILNVTEMPVILDQKTLDKLSDLDLIKSDNVDGTVLLDFAKLPIINRSMTINVSGKKLAQLEFELIQAQLGHKYLKELKKEHDPKTNEASAAKYSVEAAEWLKSIGVTDYNGFSPKTEVEKTGDFYVAPTLETKIEKTSTTPKTKDVFSKMDAIIKAETDPQIKAKPLNLMEDLMKAEIEGIHEDVFVVDQKSKDVVVSIPHLNEANNEYNIIRRQLLFEISKIKFGVILSRTWFTEFENMDQNELSLTLKGAPQELKVKFDYKEKEIAL